jgi:hypothetical protein
MAVTTDKHVDEAIAAFSDAVEAWNVAAGRCAALGLRLGIDVRDMKPGLKMTAEVDKTLWSNA